MMVKIDFKTFHGDTAEHDDVDDDYYDCDDDSNSNNDDSDEVDIRMFYYDCTIL